VKQCCDASLQRLGLDHIDLYCTTEALPKGAAAGTRYPVEGMRTVER
jgi:aryl-alcohol dehydrogenase-like predicted oxidoreductase